MAKRKPVLWCKPLIGPQRYDVVIGNASTCEDLDDTDEGACVWEQTRVAVHERLSDERKEDVFAHEVLVHAVLDVYGIKRNLKEKYQFSDEDWEAFEEDLAHQYGPALLATLKANNWAKLPRLPKRARKAGQ